MFDASSLQQMLGYKWDCYAVKHHMVGFSMHVVYVVMLNIFVYYIYMNPHTEGEHIALCTVLTASMMYSFVYDSIQMYIDGPSDYFSDKWNIVDTLYNYGGVLNIFL